MPSNHVEVTSPEHFKELLSADLKRVSCLNFWAPWAEPCVAFNKEIEAAAAKYPSVLFLKVSQGARMESCSIPLVCMQGKR
jgi:thiol-disulfide isomerase/thioredoxin